jgi:hypothetical protein
LEKGQRQGTDIKKLLLSTGAGLNTPLFEPRFQPGKLQLFSNVLNERACLGCCGKERRYKSLEHQPSQPYPGLQSAFAILNPASAHPDFSNSTLPTPSALKSAPLGHSPDREVGIIYGPSASLNTTKSPSSIRGSPNFVTLSAVTRLSSVPKNLLFTQTSHF